MAGILFDLDGVFYIGDNAIPGAAETLAWVEQHDVAHCFLTNTSSKPRQALVDKLSRLGLNVQQERILTPPVAARQWILSQQHEPAVLFVPTATEEEFRDIRCLHRNTDHPVGALVVGDLGEAWDFTTLNQAFRLLMQDPAPVLIALGMTRYWRAPDGLRLDVAPFISALQTATGIDPVILGKPASTFFHAALELVGCTAKEAVMIGDDIKGDVAAAQSNGIKAIQVHTGKFQPSDLEKGIKPDAQLDSIADLPNWWLQHFP